MDKPQIPTSVLLTEVYGDLGKGLGWSLERNKFHTDLTMVSIESDQLLLMKLFSELEDIIKENSSTLLNDLTEKKQVAQTEFFNYRNLFLRILRQRTNLYNIEGACHKDIELSVLNTGIVYILEGGKICDNNAVESLNRLIMSHPSVKEICRNLLLSYTKLIIITDTLIKCIMMAKMTGEIIEDKR